MTASEHIAVALFTRSAEAVSAKSRLRVKQSPIQDVQALHAALLAGSLHELCLLDCAEMHIFWAPDSTNTSSSRSYPSPPKPIRAQQHWQRGSTFARRFSNMLSDLYQPGPRGVLIIGSDCPYLRASHISQAIERLKLRTPCFGPAPRGGLYLLGIPAGLAQPDWQKFFAARDQHHAFNQAFPGAVRLEELGDIDIPQDLCKLLEANPRSLQQPVADFLVNQAALVLPSTQN